MADATTSDARSDSPSDDLARAFKALSDPRRMRVLRVLLAAPDTLCGCELSDILAVPDYQISRDLKALREAGLVRDRGRTGTWVHYEAARDGPAHLTEVLELVASSPMDTDDHVRFELRHGLREQAGCVLGPGDPGVVAAFEGAGLPLVGR
jgi:ArsR family transcriptional regulator, arsenate/arsenite/antimonite-responsive transcriptional repressor